MPIIATTNGAPAERWIAASAIEALRHPAAVGLLVLQMPLLLLLRGLPVIAVPRLELRTEAEPSVTGPPPTGAACCAPEGDPPPPADVAAAAAAAAASADALAAADSSDVAAAAAAAAAPREVPQSTKLQDEQEAFEAAG